MSTRTLMSARELLKSAAIAVDDPELIVATASRTEGYKFAVRRPAWPEVPECVVGEVLHLGAVCAHDDYVTLVSH